MTIRSRLKRLRRTIRKRLPLFLLAGLIVIVGIGFASLQSKTMINPTAYAPLLERIADSESNGNYNAYYGNAANTDIQFSNMTIAEVLAWQTEYVKEGSPSSAVGRYQIIQPTLEGLVEELSLNTSMNFDPLTQDRLAVKLMERRGSISFVKNEISAEEFAHNLSKEWAALPQVIGQAPNDSFYAGDGLNASRIRPAQILDSIEEFRAETLK